MGAPFLPNLTSLRLRGTPAPPAARCGLLEALSPDTLRALELTRCGFSDEDAALLVSRGFSSLETLVVDGADLSERSRDALRRRHPRAWFM